MWREVVKDSIKNKNLSTKPAFSAITSDLSGSSNSAMTENNPSVDPIPIAIERAVLSIILIIFSANFSGGSSPDSQPTSLLFAIAFELMGSKVKGAQNNSSVLPVQIPTAQYCYKQPKI